MRSVSGGQGYRMADLAALTGMSPRVIRKYRALRILPAPFGGRTRAATYGAVHLDRLRAIQRAKDANTTLLDLAERFAPTDAP